MSRSVSVMVPVYNAEETILDTLNSIKEQTYRPLEVVIVNDGSQDDTSSLVESWRNKWDSPELRVKVIEHENRGLAAARNSGLTEATGEFLQFLDSDDLLHPEKFSICLERLDCTGADVVVPRTMHFKYLEEIQQELNEAPKYKSWSRQQLRHSTITSGYWHSVGPLFRRRVLDIVGKFPVELDSVAEELEFHGRVKLSNVTINYHNQVLNFYRRGNPKSITGELRRLYQGRIAGAQVARELLTSHRVSTKIEWASLFRMNLQTYSQVIRVFEDQQLRDDAYGDILETLCAMNPVYKYAFRCMPRVMLDWIIKVSLARVVIPMEESGEASACNEINRDKKSAAQ